MAGVDDASTLTPLEFFCKFFPYKYVKEHLIPATNKQLDEMGYDETSVPEFEGWLGMWMNMSLHPGYVQEEFFMKKDHTYDWNPPFLGCFMSGNRFNEITRALCLSNDNPPKHRDRFFWVRKLIESFNAETKEAFIPGWLVVVDESMVAFLNTYCPGWTCVKRKPHPMGNEYHTTADYFCKVIFHIEIVEGKDQPTEGEHSTIKYEVEFASKVGALVVRMTEGLHGSGRTVILDSGFGYVPSVVQLRNRGACLLQRM